MILTLIEFNSNFITSSLLHQRINFIKGFFDTIDYFIINKTKQIFFDINTLVCIKIILIN